MNEQVVENIKSAANSSKTILITYRDAAGNISIRETEPYEIKDSAYWGFCLKKNSIRKFLLKNIIQTEDTDNKYIPRWEVKI